MRPASRWLAGVLLVVAIVVPLLVGVYDREDPTLFGFPFFYWYQFAWVPLTAGITYFVYRMTRPREAAS